MESIDLELHQQSFSDNETSDATNIDANFVVKHNFSAEIYQRFKDDVDLLLSGKLSPNDQPQIVGRLLSNMNDLYGAFEVEKHYLMSEVLYSWAARQQKVSIGTLWIQQQHYCLLDTISQHCDSDGDDDNDGEEMRVVNIKDEIASIAMYLQLKCDSDDDDSGGDGDDDDSGGGGDDDDSGGDGDDDNDGEEMRVVNIKDEIASIAMYLQLKCDSDDDDSGGDGDDDDSGGGGDDDDSGGDGDDDNDGEEMRVVNIKDEIASIAMYLQLKCDCDDNGDGNSNKK
uniref:Signal transducer and activator of transcription b N-terminal domain-containing protein n=1 Tax=Setaria digitata TaxID=48799 RepID=A0A915PU24_9BILA